MGEKTKAEQGKEGSDLAQVCCVPSCGLNHNSSQSVLGSKPPTPNLLAGKGRAVPGTSATSHPTPERSPCLRATP